MVISSLLWMYINKCTCPITTNVMKGLGVLLNLLKDFFFPSERFFFFFVNPFSE